MHAYEVQQEKDDPNSQGLIQAMMAKIINNVQVTVKNIHIRYEDQLSVPGVCRVASPTSSSSDPRI